MRGKKVWLPAAVLIVAAALLLGLWYVNRPQGQAGEKTVVVEVIHADESSREFTYQTSQEFLGPLLLEEGLAQGEEKKRFLAVEDIRLPGQLVFFRSPQWAGFFAAATGLDTKAL